MKNQLVLSGTVVRAPETRTTPAGIPLTRFALDHTSEQQEADLKRHVQLRIMVVAAGEALSGQARTLAAGDRLTVTGFLNRSQTRDGQPRLVLHAQALKND